MASNGARAGVAERAAGTALEAKRPPTLAQMIAQQRSQVELALPAHLKDNADAYVRAAITLVKQTPGLAKCDPLTVLGGLMTASQLGLEFGPLGHCYLVPYKGKAQFIVGYKGMIDLCWRSDRLVSISAREVCENDEFDFDYGLADSLHHKPCMTGERGRTVAYYGIAQFKGGGHYFLVMSRSDVEKHRKRSASKDNGPWTTDYDAMARKTVIRAMAPFLPLTTEVLRDLARDGVVAAGAAVADLTEDYPDVIDADAVDADDAIADAELVPDDNGWEDPDTAVPGAEQEPLLS